MARGTWGRGSSSRAIEKARGKMAPPVPITTRPAMSTPIVWDVALTAAPTVNSPSTLTRTRFLPCMSPRRPNRPVVTAAAMKKPLSVHAAPDSVVRSAVSIWGMAGMTAVWDTEYARPPSSSTPRVRLGWRCVRIV